MTGTGEAIRSMDGKMSSQNGYLSTANNVLIHSELGELYTIGEYVGSGISTARDIVIANNDSTLRCDILEFTSEYTAGSTVEYWANVTEPSTGTAVDPMNTIDHSQTSNVSARYGNAIADETSGTKIPAANVGGGGSGGVATGAFSRTRAIFRLEPGETAMVRWTPETSQRMAFNGLLAVYDPSRTIE